MQYVNEIVSQVMRIIERMTMQHWLLVLIVAVIIGALNLRGFGSRSSY